MKDKKDMHMNCFIHTLKSDAHYFVMKIKCHWEFIMPSTSNIKLMSMSKHYMYNTKNRFDYSVSFPTFQNLRIK